MKIFARWRLGVAAVLAAGAALLLAACMVSPGKFTSTLDLRRDGTFTFSYDGQIYLLALSRLAEMANEEQGAGDFVESPCWDDDDYEERACTEEEIAEQRANWEQGAEARRASSERDAEQMRQMLGGIDPADPKAAEELAERLRRQEGWKRVEYRGDGLFEVEFSLTSRLGHDFSFPTFERFPMMNSFVVANLRQGGAVRVEATGFAPQAGGNPFQAMMGGMTGLESRTSAEGGEANLPPVPEMDGTFRIVTDGQVLANNTDEGPQAGPTGQVLEWKVNRRTQSAPMALIQLAN
jgi:hypothetical protein